MSHDSSNPSLEIEKIPSPREEGEPERTLIDLGDDLLAQTRTLVLSDLLTTDLRSANGEESSKTETPDECLETARILYAEGLQEEAKRFCRRALLLDSNYGPAIFLLKTIQERELQIIMDSDGRNRQNHQAEDKLNVSPQESLRLEHQLDRDLKLGLLKETTLFRDSFLTQEDLERCLDGVGIRDHLDLAIGFMSMELWDIALSQLQIIQRGAAQGLTNEALLRNTYALMGEVYLNLRKPYEVVAILQPVLRDADMSNEEQLEFYYLMARAHELMEKSDVAFQWYQKLSNLDPQYRDVKDRQESLIQSTGLKR